ncbi:MAG: GFA family protein [Polyangiales bacterium]
MSDAATHELSGACHCGRVRVTMPAESAGVVVCHCADCQKLHGNSFALFAAERSKVRWEGEEHVRWYRSSSANERSFCAECGSRLAKRPVEGTRIMVSAGLFDHALPRKAIKNLWVEQKPAWVEAPRTGPIAPEELVALALSEPIESPTAQYGYALRAASGNGKSPGVLAITWIAAKNPAERERIRAHSRENVQDFLREPGFISIVTGFTGLRGFTVTAWEDEAAMKRALAKHHATAMRELFSEDFVASVWTSVWTPTRINRLWVRCPSCASLEDVTDDHRACSKCSATLPERPSYW